MCVLSRTTGREDNGQIYGEDKCFGEASWEEDSIRSVDLDKVINYINNNVKLSSVLDKYNIKLDFKYSSSGWNYICHCPFPDHHDVNASFGYNDSINKFNCFGCSRSGGAIQFISAKEGIEIPQAATLLLREFADCFSGSDIKDSLYINSENSKKVKSLTYSFFKKIREMRRNNINNAEFIRYLDNILWTVDVFFIKHSDVRFINIIDLQKRFDIIESKLLSFEK